MHPFQRYSRQEWIRHTQTEEGKEPDDILAGLLKKFLGSPDESSVQYREWHRRVRFNHPRRLRPPRYFKQKEISPEDASIFAICHFSFYTLLSDWWDSAEIKLSRKNTRGDSLLSLAIAAGSLHICKALIKRGMQPNMQDGDKDSPLATAAASGENLEIVRSLVEKGADVNMLLQVGDFGSALAAVAHSGWQEVTEFLINAGAIVNMRLETGLYGTALQAAKADVPEDHPLLKRDIRSDEERKQQKAEVVKLLQSHGATDGGELA